MLSFDFESPRSLDEACRLLAQTGGRLIAGGTDVIPQMRDGRFRAETLVDLSHIDELSTIEMSGGEITIGALTSYTMMRNSSLLQAHASLLSEVSGLVGGLQTQNRGTLGGNIANASPAGDTLPPLLVLNAMVDLVSSAGERSLPLEAFLQGPGQTDLAPDEIIRQVRFAPLPPGVNSLFMRLGNRQGMVISVASVAIVLGMQPDGVVDDVRIALGAVAPTAIRCRPAENILRGHYLNSDLIDASAQAAAQACQPIDDVRGSAAYRRHGVRVLVRRGLNKLAGKTVG